MIRLAAHPKSHKKKKKRIQPHQDTNGGSRRHHAPRPARTPQSAFLTGKRPSKQHQTAGLRATRHPRDPGLRGFESEVLGERSMQLGFRERGCFLAAVGVTHAEVIGPTWPRQRTSITGCEDTFFFYLSSVPVYAVTSLLFLLPGSGSRIFGCTDRRARIV